MKKLFLLMLVLVSILVVASSCGQPQPVETSPPQAETPPPQEHASFQIEVNRWGFNKTPGDFLLEVEEGQEVEITFVYGDDGLDHNNPHVIASPDYGITTGILDEDNPEVTLRFTARETGEVAFMCISYECIGHHNLHTMPMN